jgi:hypothetical protein
VRLKRANSRPRDGGGSEPKVSPAETLKVAMDRSVENLTKLTSNLIQKIKNKSISGEYS